MTATVHAPTVERIGAQAKAQVDQYIRDRETGQTTSREIKEVIESIISTDYDGRTVIELLQNAHDAHPKERRDGVILIDLQEEAGADHGCSMSRTPGTRSATRTSTRCVDWA